MENCPGGTNFNREMGAYEKHRKQERMETDILIKQLIWFACTKLHQISYSICLCGRTLSLTHSVKHLGHILSSVAMAIGPSSDTLHKIASLLVFFVMLS